MAFLIILTITMAFSTSSFLTGSPSVLADTHSAVPDDASVEILQDLETRMMVDEAIRAERQQMHPAINVRLILFAILASLAMVAAVKHTRAKKSSLPRGRDEDGEEGQKGGAKEVKPENQLEVSRPF